MAVNLCSVQVGSYGNRAFDSGKPYNVYTTWADAIAHTSSNLASISDFNRLTGLIGSAITQVAKLSGLVPDQYGRLNFFCSNAADIYIVTEGANIPIRVASTAF